MFHKKFSHILEKILIIFDIGTTHQSAYRLKVSKSVLQKSKLSEMYVRYAGRFTWGLQRKYLFSDFVARMVHTRAIKNTVATNKIWLF